jgi:predicted dehydrogenase
MSIGVAFIGGGMVSELHQLALSSVPGMDLVGLHDINADVRQKRAAEWGIQPYASLDELQADDAVDVVYILTPAETHVSLAMKCIEGGRHVFVEKPVSNKPEAIDQLVEVSERCGCVVMPGHNYVYVPEFQRIARLVREGKLGTVRAMWINYAIKHPEFVAAAYGGVLEEVMIHHTYMTLALFGKPERVYAGIYVGAWEYHPEEDQAWMVWEYPGGMTAHLFSTFAVDDNSADPWTFVVKVLGTEGSASMTWRSSIFNRALGTLSFAVPIYEESYEGEARNLREAIERGVPVLSTLRDAAASARIITAAYEAADKHTAITQMDGEKRRW